jgi:two-component system sensor histidine kinase ArlS
VDNSIKYSRDGGGEVIIAVKDEQDKLSVRVIDNGIGIPEEDLPYIFDTAYRATDTLSIKRAGTGLGLAIAKRIVEQHGGEIQVRSQVGGGTTVSFDLPLYIPS